MITGWYPIKGYEELYFINDQKQVCNRDGHIMKPIMTKNGWSVELYKDGQREKIPVAELIANTGGCNNETARHAQASNQVD